MSGSADPGDARSGGGARGVDGGVTGSPTGPHPASRPVRVAVIDHGAGNLVSIGQALVAVGAAVRSATYPDDLDDADLLVLPGVGAAAPAMARLNERDLVGAIRRWLDDDRPFLGICLGLQLLFDGSDEDDATTLRVVPGRALLLEAAPTLPHIGWNQVMQRREHPLFEGIADGSDFYFVHSFAGRPSPPASDWSLADTTHGTASFVSAVARGNRHGVQFHPERSGRDGLRLLANAVALAAAIRDGTTTASAAGVGAD